MMFFTHKKSKANSTDYKNLLEIFAEMNVQRFDDLSESNKKELLGAWLNDPKHEDDVLNLMVDVSNSEILSELMYGSISNDKAGKLITKLILNGDHIKCINADIDEAFTEYLLTIEEEHEDETHRDKSLVKILRSQVAGM
jgi:hypothetical protein